MAHGYAGAKEQGLERFARAFTDLHDHRNSERATALSVTMSIHGAGNVSSTRMSTPSFGVSRLVASESSVTI